ncbi:Tfp pilus assembly protein PilN [gamma proteobacterium HTCC5015]|nr:Tfp pilus assembly protein PilN [gamma proteobacterium HTCC5015]
MSTQRINLLPWREELRQAKNQEFGIVAAIAVALCAALLFAIYLYFQDRISYQEERNSYLKNEITVLDSKLETIKELENTKKDLLARMKIIQELQGSRSQVVHSFEDIVTALPDGIWVSKILQKGDSITVNGYAESNARVSAYMRNLDESDWFKEPTLVNIENDKDADGAAFSLEVTQDSPNSSESDLDN